MKISSALVVGIDRYTNISGLKYCSNDAIHLAERILEVKAFSATQGSVQVLMSRSGTSPTRATIMSKLGRILAVTNPNTGVLFYFAGHGIEIDGQPYLLPADFDPDLPELTSIAVPELMSAIRRSLVARRVIILDSCYSGLHRGERTPSKEGFQAFQTAFGRTFDAAQEGTAVLSSTSINEKARERKFGDSGHGIFTFSLIRALDDLKKRSLQGEDVRIEDLHEFAYRETISNSNGQQHPRFFYSVGDPIIVFRAATRTRPKPNSSVQIEKNTLLKQLSSNNPELQRVAAENIIQHGKELVEDLIPRLGHGRSDVRNWAAFCLGEIGDIHAILPLLGAIRDRPLQKRNEPFAERAIEALTSIGAEAIPIAIDYIDKENLKSHEIVRILKGILPVWDGSGNAQGQRIIALIFTHSQSRLLMCPKTDFIIQKVEDEFHRFVEGIPSKIPQWTTEDRIWGGARYLIGYLLRYAPERVLNDIRSNHLFQSGYYFLCMIISACEDAGGENSVILVREISKKTDVKPKYKFQKSLQMLSERALRSLELKGANL